MPHFCAVNGCRNTRKNNDLVFHRFPGKKDPDSTRLRDEWISRCARSADFNYENNRICSTHFSDDDYERDFKNELLGLPIKKILKKTAVPSLNIPMKYKEAPPPIEPESNSDPPSPCELIIIEMSEEEKRIQERKELVESLLQESSQPSTSKNTTTTISPYQYKLLSEKYETLKAKYIQRQKLTRTLAYQLEYYKEKCLRLQKIDKNKVVTGLLKHVLNENKFVITNKNTASTDS